MPLTIQKVFVSLQRYFDLRSVTKKYNPSLHLICPDRLPHVQTAKNVEPDEMYNENVV